jgi:DNA-binding transcriptional regulator YhcF (GntR family)
MFVADGARARLVAQRRNRFREQFIAPLIAAAHKLGISPAQLAGMIEEDAR